jgi:hypothetical protein
MNGLRKAELHHDRECPFDSDTRTDAEIEADAAERIESQRVKVELIRDDAAWARVAIRREEAQRIAEHDATVAAMKGNPAFAALFDASKWSELI